MKGPIAAAAVPPSGAVGPGPIPKGNQHWPTPIGFGPALPQSEKTKPKKWD
jgi:hypothetical protein